MIFHISNKQNMCEKQESKNHHKSNEHHKNNYPTTMREKKINKMFQHNQTMLLN